MGKRGTIRLLAFLAVAVVAVVVAAVVWRPVPAQSSHLEEPPAPVDQTPPAPAPEPEPPAPSAPEPEVLVPYDGPVEHIFFHPLIAYPELAFDGDSMARGYNDYFVTVPEFKRIIEQLYQHNFILVDLASLFTETTVDGKTVLARRPLELPPGKKPLVLSIDDLNYYDYMRANGNVYRLVLDGQNRIATWSLTPQKQEIVAYDNEIIPILDDFVAAHPDFALHGAKGVIALTGYEGVLGYRTNDPKSPTYEQDRQAAMNVAQRLKETGWSFASHSWGHMDTAKLSYSGFTLDARRWKAEVEPLIGPTNIFIYPFGSTVPPGDAKFKLLLDQGFRIFCGVGPRPYLDVTDRYARMDRRHIDGIALQSLRTLNLELFDADQVIDPVRPPHK